MGGISNLGVAKRHFYLNISIVCMLNFGEVFQIEFGGGDYFPRSALFVLKHCIKSEILRLLNAPAKIFYKETLWSQTGSRVMSD